MGFTPKIDPHTADVDSLFVLQFHHEITNGPKVPGRAANAVDVTYDLAEFVTAPSEPYIMYDEDGVVHTYVWNFMADIDLDAVTVSLYNGSEFSLAALGCADGDSSGYVYQIEPFSGQCLIAGGKSVNWT